MLRIAVVSDCAQKLDKSLVGAVEFCARGQAIVGRGSAQLSLKEARRIVELAGAHAEAVLR
jgi:hypothetical protein